MATIVERLASDVTMPLWLYALLLWFALIGFRATLRAIIDTVKYMQRYERAHPRRRWR